MNIARKTLGVLLILGGIVLAVWIDLFVLFIGGINEVVNGYNAQPNNGHEIAWGFVKIFVFTGLGVAAGAAVIAMGCTLIGIRSRRSRRFRRNSGRPLRDGRRSSNRL